MDKKFLKGNSSSETLKQELAKVAINLQAEDSLFQKFTKNITDIRLIGGALTVAGGAINFGKSMWDVLIEKPITTMGGVSDNLDKITKAGRSAMDIYEVFKYNKEVAEKKLIL